MTLHVEVVSPEKVLWSGEAERVITRTDGEGDIAFLTGHTSFMGALGSGITEILQEGGAVINVAVHGGFVEVSDDRVSILSDVAELAEHVDVVRARRAKEAAEAALGRGGGEEEAELREALARAVTRLRAAGDPDAA